LQEALLKKVNNIALIAAAATNDANNDENMVESITREVNVLNAKYHTIIADLQDINRSLIIHIGR
jgi:hypothetical protein